MLGPLGIPEYSLPRTYIRSATARESPRKRYSVVNKKNPNPSPHHAVLHKKFLQTCAEPTLEALSKQIEFYGTPGFIATLWKALAEDDVYPFVKLVQLDPTLVTLRGAVDKQGRTMAHIACRDGCVKVLRVILDVHVDCDLFCKWLTLKTHMSLLHYAVIGGQMAIVEMLFRHYYRKGYFFMWFEELFQETHSGKSSYALAQDYDWYNIEHWLKKEMKIYEKMRDEWLLQGLEIRVRERHERDIFMIQREAVMGYQKVVEEEWRLRQPLREKKAKLLMWHMLMVEANIAPPPVQREEEEEVQVEEEVKHSITKSFTMEDCVSSAFLAKSKLRHLKILAEAGGEDRDGTMATCCIRPMFAVRDRVKDLLHLHAEEQRAAEKAAIILPTRAVDPRDGTMFPYLGMELTDGVHFRTFARAPPRVRVVGIVPKGAAEESGVVVGSYLTHVNGAAISDLASLRDVLLRCGPLKTASSFRVTFQSCDGITSTVTMCPRTTGAVPSHKTVRRTKV